MKPSLKDEKMMWQDIQIYHKVTEEIYSDQKEKLMEDFRDKGVGVGL